MEKGFPALSVWSRARALAATGDAALKDQAWDGFAELAAAPRRGLPKTASSPNLGADLRLLLLRVDAIIMLPLLSLRWLVPWWLPRPPRPRPVSTSPRALAAKWRWLSSLFIKARFAAVSVVGLSGVLRPL